jgi:transketolase
MTTGALGQGLSAAIGIALGNRLDGIDSTVYCIIGDGESNEGQIWEAAMAASQFGVSNLIAFTDYNKMEIDGYMHEIMNIEDITAKWVAFGWFVQRVNGHDLAQMDMAIQRAKAEKYRPSMVVLDTIKGKGAFFAEGKVGSHNMPFDYATAQEAIARLDRCG